MLSGDVTAPRRGAARGARRCATSFWIPLLVMMAGACAGRRRADPSSVAPSPPAPPSAGASGTEASREAPGPAGGLPSPNPGTTAFAADAKATANGRSRSLKLRFYAAAPDRFRVELRGPVGGIALVATGRGGTVRIVLPSRRMYAEGALEDDLGSGLLGVPLRGCDLAMVMRISTGLKRFQPCAGPDEAPAADEPPGPADRPGLIVDTSLSGDEVIRFGFDWTGDGDLPREVRVEIGGPSEAVIALQDLRRLEFPRQANEDFFWEPLPERARRTSLQDLAGAEEP